MNPSPDTDSLIGIFDSGVGGLSVLRQIQALMPAAPFYYLADQAHVPFGRRSLRDIRALSFAIARFLIAQGASIIVVACNTASAAALDELRAAFPDVPFVGMEPAVKPASQHTRNGVVGVLATPATFQGRLYAALVERFAKGVHILSDTLPGLVEAIEAGDLDGAETRRILEAAIRPMVSEGADTLVLGCTHFPFVLPLIREIAGPAVEVIDSAPAIARRTQSLLGQHSIQLRAGPSRARQFGTTGEVESFRRAIRALCGLDAAVSALSWRADEQEIIEKRN